MCTARPRLSATQDTKITKALFRVADTNESGTIDFIEFAELLAKVDSYNDIQRLQWTFALYDTDGGGSLDLEELHEHLNDANTALRFPYQRLRQVFKHNR